MPSEKPTQETEKKAKKPKQKSLMETIREIDEKEAQREQEAEQKRQELIAEQEAKAKEEHAKQLAKDKVELIRLKQGVITESDTIREESHEKEKLPLGKRIGNFLYHSKWWLGITVVIIAIFSFLIYDYVTREKADLIVMVLSDDDDIQNSSQQLETYFEQFCDDENGDGKVHVGIYAIPTNEDMGEDDYYTGNMTKLTTEMHLADSVLILTDAVADEMIESDETLENLEDIYGDTHENIRGTGYYLRHTDFATKIGYPGKIDRDVCLSLRTPITTYDSLADMQENYDIAKKVLERVMDDLDNTQEPE